MDAKEQAKRFEAAYKVLKEQWKNPVKKKWIDVNGILAVMEDMVKNFIAPNCQNCHVFAKGFFGHLQIFSLVLKGRSILFTKTSVEVTRLLCELCSKTELPWTFISHMLVRWLKLVKDFGNSLRKEIFDDLKTTAFVQCARFLIDAPCFSSKFLMLNILCAYLDPVYISYGGSSMTEISELFHGIASKGTIEFIKSIEWKRGLSLEDKYRILERINPMEQTIYSELVHTFEFEHADKKTKIPFGHNKGRMFFNKLTKTIEFIMQHDTNTILVTISARKMQKVQVIDSGHCLVENLKLILRSEPRLETMNGEQIKIPDLQVKTIGVIFDMGIEKSQLALLLLDMFKIVPETLNPSIANVGNVSNIGTVVSSPKMDFEAQANSFEELKEQCRDPALKKMINIDGIVAVMEDMVKNLTASNCNVFAKGIIRRLQIITELAVDGPYFSFTAIDNITRLLCEMCTKTELPWADISNMLVHWLKWVKKQEHSDLSRTFSRLEGSAFVQCARFLIDAPCFSSKFLMLNILCAYLETGVVPMAKMSKLFHGIASTNTIKFIQSIGWKRDLSLNGKYVERGLSLNDKYRIIERINPMKQKIYSELVDTFEFKDADKKTKISFDSNKGRMFFNKLTKTIEFIVPHNSNMILVTITASRLQKDQKADSSGHCLVEYLKLVLDKPPRFKTINGEEIKISDLQVKTIEVNFDMGIEKSRLNLLLSDMFRFVPEPPKLGFKAEAKIIEAAYKKLKVQCKDPAQKEKINIDGIVVILEYMMKNLTAPNGIVFEKGFIDHLHIISLLLKKRPNLLPNQFVEITRILCEMCSKTELDWVLIYNMLVHWLDLITKLPCAVRVYTFNELKTSAFVKCAQFLIDAPCFSLKFLMLNILCKYLETDSIPMDNINGGLSLNNKYRILEHMNEVKETFHSESVDTFEFGDAVKKTFDDNKGRMFFNKLTKTIEFIVPHDSNMILVTISARKMQKIQVIDSGHCMVKNLKLILRLEPRLETINGKPIEVRALQVMTIDVSFDTGIMKSRLNLLLLDMFEKRPETLNPPIENEAIRPQSRQKQQQPTKPIVSKEARAKQTTTNQADLNVMLQRPKRGAASNANDEISKMFAPKRQKMNNSKH